MLVRASRVPAASVTGVAYYLIHHLRNNDRVARLTAPALPALPDPADGAKLTLDTPSQTFQVNLDNHSNWLDLIPVVKAQINDAASAWNIAFGYDGRDVTVAVRSAGGFCFYKADRLNPGNRRVISVTVTSTSGRVSHAALEITLQLFPHPTTLIASQNFRLQNFAP